MNAHECVFRVHIYIYVLFYTSVFQLDTCLCSRRTRVCYQMNTRVCVCLRFCVHINVCVHVCSTRVCSLVRMCVFTCAHVCVPTGLVYVCQENTCLLSDEHLSAPHVCSTCTHLCVQVCTHVRSNWTRACVPGEHTHIYIYIYVFVCSRVHTSVFQLDTCLCSRRTRVCYQMNTRVCLCFCVRINVCVHVRSTRVCSLVHMCVHLRTCVSPTRTHICVFTCAHTCVLIIQVYVFQVNTCLLSDEYLCVSAFLCAHKCVCSRVQHTCGCSRVHMCAFQLDTCMCSRRTRVCYQTNTCLLRMSVPRVHICVFKFAHMCVPTGHVLVFQENTCMQSDESVCVCIGPLRVHMYVCSNLHICVFHVYTLVCSRVDTCVFQLDTFVFLVSTCLLSDERT